MKHWRFGIATLAVSSIGALLIGACAAWAVTRDWTHEKNDDTKPVTVAVSNFIDAFNNGNVQRLDEITCGAFAGGLQATDAESLKKQAAQLIQEHGKIAVTGFRGTSIEGNHAITIGHMTFERDTSDDQNVGHQIVFGLENVDHTWRMCWYTPTP